MIRSMFTTWGTREVEQVPEDVKVDLGETDKEKVKETQELIHEMFGDNLVEKMKSVSNKQRLDMMDEFANELAKRYGLEVDIDIVLDQANACGAYFPGQKKFVFNIITIMDTSVDNFDYYVRTVFETIIHELRHAVQHKALEEPGFWGIDDERRKTWKENMDNYIRPEVDFRGYARQPIEADATTFAGAVLEGVK